jgi:hypothetical protein
LKKIEAKVQERKKKRSWFENLVTNDNDVCLLPLALVSIECQVNSEIGETALKDLYELVGYDAEKAAEMEIVYPDDYVKTVINLTIEKFVFRYGRYFISL